MIALFRQHRVFLDAFDYRIGSRRRTVEELREGGLLANSVEEMWRIGYRQNRTVGPGEDLVSLAVAAARPMLDRYGPPSLVITQHCVRESAVVLPDSGGGDCSGLMNYFTKVFESVAGLEGVPFFCGVGNCCAGFLSMALTAAWQVQADPAATVLCVTGDVRPPSTTYDIFQEKFLTSDASGVFRVQGQPCGYQLMGLHYYSTSRTTMPLMELAKRVRAMIRELAEHVGASLGPENTLVHYPNIFPLAWKSVTSMLGLGPGNHVLDELEERAHCWSTDPIISLAKHHRGEDGRWHVVVTYGGGLHIGVGLLQEAAEG